MSLSILTSECWASSSIRDRLLRLKITGNEIAEQYIKVCVSHELCMRDGQKKPYKYSPLKNFGVIKPKRKNEKAVEQFYKSSNSFLNRVIQWCHINRIPPGDLQQFISIPMALATPEGLPIQKDKSDANKFYKKHFHEAFCANLSHLLYPHKTLIIDAMVIIYQFRPQKHHKSFGEYCHYLFTKCIVQKFRLQHFEEIHLCFGRQNVREITPKDIERTRRDNSAVSSTVYSDKLVVKWDSEKNTLDIWMPLQIL